MPYFRLTQMAIVILMAAATSALAAQPTQQVLSVSQDGPWVLASKATKPVYKDVQYSYTVDKVVTMTQAEVVNGVVEQKTISKTVPETRTATRRVCYYVSESQIRTVDPSTVRAFETDGRPVKTADVIRRCSHPTLVVVAHGDQMIPAYYADVFRPGTLILAVTPPPLASGSAGVPVAPAPGPAAPMPRDPQETMPFPATPAPELVFISPNGSDALNIRQYREQPLENSATVYATDSAVAPEKQVVVKQVEKNSMTSSIPWSALRISNGKDGPVPPARVKETLGQKESTAVLALDGKLIDDFWLQNIKPTTLLIRGVELQQNFGMRAPVQEFAPPFAPEKSVPPISPPPAAPPTGAPPAPATGT